jgi:hypothetical protein
VGSNIPKFTLYVFVYTIIDVQINLFDVEINLIYAQCKEFDNAYNKS